MRSFPVFWHNELRVNNAFYAFYAFYASTELEDREKVEGKMNSIELKTKIRMKVNPKSEFRSPKKIRIPNSEPTAVKCLMKGRER